MCPGLAAPAPWLSAFLLWSQVGWPGESRWQVGLTVEDSPALGAPLVGSLTDVVAEGTLLNMVLRRMHRPRSCSYQLLLEHQRPSRIQGLRWVSASCLPRPGTRAGGGPGLGAWAYCSWPSLLWGSRGYCRVDSGSGSLAAVCGGGSHSCAECVCVRVVPKCPLSELEGRGKGFVVYPSPLRALG